MVSITQLEYILAVNKFRHFGKAAKAMHVTQPTLSQQIQKLEDDLGVIVFDRLQKPILPTPEGMKILQQAQLVIQEQQKLMHIAQKKKGTVSGRFKMGIIPTVGSQLIPLFVGNFAEKYPDVELTIEEMKTEAIIRAIKEDQIDGAILATPLEEPSFKEHPLYYESFYLYLSEGHPLLKKQILSATDLDENEMWLLQDGHCFKSQMAHFCSINSKRDSVYKNIHFQSGSLDALIAIVQKNKGYTMIPALMLERFSHSEIKKHVRAFKTPVPTREISFIYRRDHWKIDIIRAIEDSIREKVPTETVSLEKEKNKNLLLDPS